MNFFSFINVKVLFSSYVKINSLNFHEINLTKYQAVVANPRVIMTLESRGVRTLEQ